MSEVPSPTIMHDTVPRFFDADSGACFELHPPYARPDLWARYLQGAQIAYRSYGVEEALELEAVRSGLSTTLFIVGMSAEGDVVAGARFQGPLITPGDAHVSIEFANSAGEGLVLSILNQRIPEGVIEFKAGWTRPGHPAGRALSDAIARSFVHAMRWLNVRYGCCSAASYATRRWGSSGGRVMDDLKSVPYPSDRYQTTLLWWDQLRLADDADPRQWDSIEREWRQIQESAALPLRGDDLLALG